MIAAEQTGRHAFLMELDPLYSDVIVDRYQRSRASRDPRTDGNFSHPDACGRREVASHLVAIPLAVLEDVEVVRIAVASELHERPDVANMLWGTSRFKYSGPPVLEVKHRSSPPATSAHDRLDGGKSLIENHSSMFRVAIVVQVGCLEAPVTLCVCIVCSSCHGLPFSDYVTSELKISMRSGEREHQAPAVVPIDLDLRPPWCGWIAERCRAIRKGPDRDLRACGSVGFDLRLWVHRSWLRFLSFRGSYRQGFSLHRVDRFASQEVFGKKRAGGLWLLRSAISRSSAKAWIPSIAL